MKQARVNAVVCAVVYAACLYMYGMALDRELLFWAWVHAVTGAWAAAQVGWFAAVAAMRPPRPGRLSAEGWRRVIERLNNEH